MRLARREARVAFDRGEVPIGAVLVRDDQVISVGSNRVEDLQDASAHAELLCMRAGAAQLRSWRLSNATLYCTVEPCPMCAAALQAFRVERLVYGAANPRLGAFESAMRQEAPPLHPYHPSMEVSAGVLAVDSAELMRAFFRKCRERKAHSAAPLDTGRSRVRRFVSDVLRGGRGALGQLYSRLRRV